MRKKVVSSKLFAVALSLMTVFSPISAAAAEPLASVEINGSAAEESGAQLWQDYEQEDIVESASEETGDTDEAVDEGAAGDAEDGTVESGKMSGTEEAESAEGGVEAETSTEVEHGRETVEQEAEETVTGDFETIESEIIGTEAAEPGAEEAMEEAAEEETTAAAVEEKRITIPGQRPEKYELWEEVSPGVYGRSLVRDAGIAVASLDEEGLTKLNGPTNVRWSTETPGAVCWDAEDGAEGCYFVRFYKDGKIFLRIRTNNWGGDQLFFEFNQRIMESGTYTFEICSIGRDGVSADSDYIVCEEEFVYERPSEELGITDRLWWDTQVKTKACWNAVKDSADYDVELYCDARMHSGWTFSGSTLCGNLAADMTESGKYQFTVQALSSDITKVANGQISGMSPVYDTTASEGSVKDVVESALEMVSSNPDAALEMVKELNREELAVSMQTNAEILDEVSRLEEAYADAKGISTATVISDEVAAVLDASGISLTGVALNAPEGVTEMSMNFTAPDEGTGIIVKDWQYSNTIQFNIDLNGEAYTDELEVPIRITMPVPAGLPEERLEILHFHRDGSYELVFLNRNSDGTVSFTVTSLSPFVFAERAIPAESIALSAENVTLQCVGDSGKLEAVILPENASWRDIIFSSSDESVAGVDQNGVITAVGKGRAVIAASSVDSSVTAYCSVIVLSESGDEKTGDFWVEEIEPLIYTGAKLCPQVKVYDGTVLLEQGKDYKLTYKNNTNVYEGTNVKKQPQVVVTGLGNYTGSATVYFSIVPADIEKMRADDIVVAGTASGKKAQKPVPAVYDGSKKLKNKTDYSVSYPDDREGAYIKPGTYAIEITGLKNYTGKKTIYLTITEQKLISKVTVGKIANQSYQGGNAVEPPLVVKYSGKTLTIHEDYEVTYENQYLPGKATAVITGIGGYAGTKTVTYTITGIPVNKSAAVEGFISSVQYTGAEIRQDKAVLKVKAVRLEEGRDYEVSYLKNINAGTATMVFTGINGYTGTLKKNFKITPYSGVLSVSCDELVPYAKGGAKPEITVMANGVELIPNVDYTVKYSANTSVTQNSALAKITVKGKGNYKDAAGTGNFRIERQSLEQLRISVQDVAYSKTPGKVKGVPVITDLNGQKLKAGTDYDKSLIFTYAENTEVLDKKGNIVIRGAGTAVDLKQDIPPAGTVLRVEAKGIKSYSGSITAEYTVRKQSFANAKVSVEAQTYSGKEICLDEADLTVKIGKEVLVLGEDYEIVESSYQNNINKGNASVTVRGINNYAGSKNVKFTIRSRSIFWWWL